jgi:plasmid stability protein
VPLITIHNVPEEILRALHVRAIQHGRSDEAEIRDILEKAVMLERFIVKWNQFCWLKRSRMIDRPAQVIAQIYGQAGRSISRPVSANPEGAGHLSARIRGDRLGRTSGYGLRQSPLP